MDILPPGLIDIRQILDYLETDRYLDKASAATYLSLSVRTLENYMGEIQHYKIKRKILFKRSELDTWMQRHRVKSGSRDDLNQIAEDAIRSVLN